MNARQKLNHIHVVGALVLASVLGGLFQSMMVFLIASAAMIAGAIYVGDIRPRARRRP